MTLDCRLYLITPPALTDLAAFGLDLKKALEGGDVDHRMPDGQIIRIPPPAGLRSGDKVRARESYEKALRYEPDNAKLSKFMEENLK